MSFVRDHPTDTTLGVVKAVIDALPDPHVIVDPGDRIRAANTAFEDLAGYGRGELAGRPVRSVLPGRNSGTTSCLRRDASVVPVTVHTGRLGIDDRVFVIHSVRDEREAARARARLLHAASTDPLTGLSNRRGLEERLEELKEKDASANVAVFTVDLDAFKQINDREGHPSGDMVLRHVADRLTGAVRLGDTVARVGGDEFVVVCPGQDRTEAMAIADRLLERVNRPVAVEDRIIDVRASVGAAVTPAEALARAITESDESLYVAKRAGRGRSGPVLD